MKQTVEEATKEYCMNNIPHLEHLHLSIETAFEAGAEWRINSIWHDNTEFPERNRVIMIEYENSLCTIGFIGKRNDNSIQGLIVNSISGGTWLLFDRVTKWAYIDDLLPC